MQLHFVGLSSFFLFFFFFGLSKLADFEILNGWNVHSEWKLWKRVIKYKNYPIKKSICIQPEILLKRFKTNTQANETVKHVKKKIYRWQQDMKYKYLIGEGRQTDDSWFITTPTNLSY